MPYPIAIVIPTRNRGEAAIAAVDCILRDPIDMDIVVVDQSTDARTESAFAAISDSRVRLIRSSLRGASNARNAGVAATSAPIIAFTDDDCRPTAGWASALLRVMLEYPDASLVFGRVTVPPKEDASDFAAAFEPKNRVQQGGVPLPNVNLGISANMAIRRETFLTLGGFDPYLGPGAPIFSAGGEETDLVIRALHAGHKIINAAECEVLHLGVRKGAAVRKLIVGYRIAVGAAFAKYARLTGRTGVRDIARWSAFFGAEIAHDLMRGRRARPGALIYFAAGVGSSFRYGVDERRKVFRPRTFLTNGGRKSDVRDPPYTPTSSRLP